jgi:hypothetical protein
MDLAISAKRTIAWWSVSPSPAKARCGSQIVDGLSVAGLLSLSKIDLIDARSGHQRGEMQ